MSASSPTDMTKAIETANLVLDHARYHEPHLQAILKPLYCDLKEIGRDDQLTVPQTVIGFFTLTAAGIVGTLAPSPARVEALQALGLARAAVERALAARGD